MKSKLRLIYDEAPRPPSADGDLWLHSFHPSHIHYCHPDTVLERGRGWQTRGVVLACHQHGEVKWTRAQERSPTLSIRGYDTAHYAGMLVRKDSECYEEITDAEADAFLKRYTAWCNGYVYRIEDLRVAEDNDLDDVYMDNLESVLESYYHAVDPVAAAELLSNNIGQGLFIEVKPTDGWITEAIFEAALHDVVQEMTSGELHDIPGVAEVVREELREELIEKLRKNRESYDPVPRPEE